MKSEGSITMSKRIKKLIIVLIILTVIYFLMIGADYFFLKYYIFPAFEPYQPGEVRAFPGSTAEVPDDFAEYTAAGLKLYAPDCFQPETDSNEVFRGYLGKDTSQYDLIILSGQDQNSLVDFYEVNEQNGHLMNKWITGHGWLMKLGMKKIGYRIPENNNEMMYLLQKMNPDDYNPLSLTESYAFSKLAIIKAINIPAMIGYVTDDRDHPLETPAKAETCTYYYEADSVNAIIRQGRSEGGRYRLDITFYPDSDDDTVQKLWVASDDPALALMSLS